MKFPFLKKSSKQALLTISDENFLMVSWSKRFTPKHAEVKRSIEKAENRLEKLAEKVPKITQTLPYLTFLQAEYLFTALQETFETFTFERLQLVHREGNQLLTKEEVFASPFSIEITYENCLISLTESLFLNPAFKDISYDEKCSYLLEDIFPSYQSSLGVGQEAIPVLPEVDEIESGEFQIHLPAPQLMSERETENKEKEMQRPSQSQSSLADEKYDGTEGMHQNTQEKLSDFSVLFDENQESDSEYTISGHDFQSHLPSLQENVSTSNMQLIEGQSDHSKVDSVQPVQILDSFRFPRMPIVQFPKEHYEPFEKEYVSWRLNEIRKEENAYIEEREQMNLQLMQQALFQQLDTFEKQQLAKVQAYLQEKDSRAGLRAKILSECKQQELKAKHTYEKELDSRQEEALQAEKIRYEQAVTKIKKQFQEQKKQAFQQMTEEWYKYAQSTYQTRFYEETAKLQRDLDEQMAAIQKRKQVKEQEMQWHFQEIIHQVGNQLLQERQAKLVEKQAAFIKQHEYAKHQHYLLEQQKQASKQQQLEKETLKQVQEQMAVFRAEKEKLQNEIRQRDQQLYQEKLQALEEQKSFFKEQRQLFKQRKTMAELTSEKLETSLQVNEAQAIFSDPKLEKKSESIIKKPDEGLTRKKHKHPTNSTKRKKRWKKIIIGLVVVCLFSSISLGATEIFHYFSSQQQYLKELKSEQTKIRLQMKIEKQKTQKNQEDLKNIQTNAQKTLESLQRTQKFVDKLTEQVQANSMQQEQLETYTFPIVEGGTPTDPYFTGTGKVVQP